MLDVVGAGLLGRITDDAVRALKRTHGQPWVSTIAADSRDSLCAKIAKASGPEVVELDGARPPADPVTGGRRGHRPQLPAPRFAMNACG